MSVSVPAIKYSYLIFGIISLLVGLRQMAFVALAPAQQASRWIPLVIFTILLLNTAFRLAIAYLHVADRLFIVSIVLSHFTYIG